MAHGEEGVMGVVGEWCKDGRGVGAVWHRMIDLHADFQRLGNRSRCPSWRMTLRKSYTVPWQLPSATAPLEPDVPGGTWTGMFVAPP